MRDELLARIERLERQNRRIKAIGLVLLLCVCALFGMAQTNQSITTEKIFVRDPSTKATVTIDPKLGIVLLSERGNTTILNGDCILLTGNPYTTITSDGVVVERSRRVIGHLP